MKKPNLIFREAKKSLKLATPLLFSEWLFALNFFVITWISAQLGRETLAAIAIAQSIYFFLMMMISGISAATAILAAQDLGAKNFGAIKHIFAQSVILNVILSLIACLILWNIPHFLPSLGIKDEQVTGLIKIALRAFMWSLIPTSFLMMIEKFLIGLHRTRLVLLFTILTIPISMSANYFLALGKFGLPKFGIAGFGYGLSIAYGSLVLMFIIISILTPSLRSYRLFYGFKNLSSNFKYLFEIWRIGWPLGAMFSIEVGAILTFTFFMSLFGTDVLAAFQITRQYLVFALTTLFALTETAAVQVSHAIGEQNRFLVKLRFHANIVIVVVFMLALSCIYLLAKNLLISFDINMSDLKNYNIIFYTRHFLSAIAILILFDGIRNITAGALRGLKDTKSNMYSSILGYWLIGLPLAFVLGKLCGLKGEGLWIGFISGIAISATYLVIRFQKLSTKADLQALLLK